MHRHPQIVATPAPPGGVSLEKLRTVIHNLCEMQATDSDTITGRHGTLDSGSVSRLPDPVLPASVYAMQPEIVLEQLRSTQQKASSAAARAEAGLVWFLLDGQTSSVGSGCPHSSPSLLLVTAQLWSSRMYAGAADWRFAHRTHGVLQRVARNATGEGGWRPSRRPEQTPAATCMSTAPAPVVGLSELLRVAKYGRVIQQDR